MKQTNILQTIILLLGLLLLTVGCNSDNEGIFRLISQSEETVEVGEVTIITHSGSTLFAHTKKGGLQSYNTATKAYTRIDATETPVYANQVSTDGTNVYYYARGNEVDNNTLYKFPVAGPSYPSTPYNSDYDLLSMAPQHDLMVTRESTDVKVRKISSPTPELATYADYNVDVLLLSQPDATNDYYLLSGYKMVSGEKVYQNQLYKGSNKVTLNGLPTTVGVRAFFAGTTGLAVIATNGDVYYDAAFNLSGVSSDTSATLIKGESINLFPTTKLLSAVPVLHKNVDDFFYVQGSNGNMFKVDPTTGLVVETPFSSISTTVRVSSFYSDGSDYYIGTTDNGIFKIDFPL